MVAQEGAESLDRVIQLLKHVHGLLLRIQVQAGPAEEAFLVLPESRVLSHQLIKTCR